jgi:hypothetical protein
MPGLIFMCKCENVPFALLRGRAKMRQPLRWRHSASSHFHIYTFSHSHIVPLHHDYCKDK